jgi:hypothetical protein
VFFTRWIPQIAADETGFLDENQRGKWSDGKREEKLFRRNGAVVR